MEWRAWVRSGDIGGGEVERMADLMEEMMDQVRFEGYGPSWWTTDRAVGVTVSTDAADAGQAVGWIGQVAAAFEAALVRVGHPVGVAHVEIGHADDA